MSDVEKSRKATEFQSVTEADSPPEDTNENMDDEVFSNNESTKQKNHGDKKTCQIQALYPPLLRKDQEDVQEHVEVLTV